MTRYTIRFTGRVQGVGFRFTTHRVAAGHAVQGWVRNESDGSVRCVVEGGREELDRFVESVRETLGGNIDDASIETGDATGEFAGFAIRH